MTTLVACTSWHSLRLKATIVSWLKALPEQVRAGITRVCTDMWEGYVTAVEEVVPEATIVIDPFHVAFHYRDAIDTVRKPEIKRLRKQLFYERHNTRADVMWPLRKRAGDLTEEERERLQQLFELSLALQCAYTLREELSRIF